MSPQSLWTYLILYAGTENSVHTVILSVNVQWCILP